MATNHAFPRTDFEREPTPLDIAQTTYEWLITGPNPVAIDGRLFPRLPNRDVPLNEVCDRLLHPKCPHSVRDAVWAHLVLLSRTGSGTWIIAAVGVALPALTTLATKLCAGFVGDRSDVHSAILTGFVAELATIDLSKPRIMARLRFAAHRAGHVAIREIYDAPTPTGGTFHSTPPRPPWAHEDFVLARAIADGVITADEAELIASTRLEGVPLVTAGEVRGQRYEAVKKARQRAEARLVPYLRGEVVDSAPGQSGERDPADWATDAVIISTASRASTATTVQAPTVTDVRELAAKKTRRRMSPEGRFSGVKGCGRTPATPATTAPPDRPAAPSSMTPEASRCA
jgi:hypothetical protein